MSKSYFHNQKPIYENKNQTKITPVFNVVTKRAVDINILLNRVKIEKKNAIKRKIIFISTIVLTLSLIGTFISLIK
jgi:hypothetical protein|tara:strand:- start:233 stop:460 length:228 start_codon:yes stop_codon:yes gene_type:complete